MATYEQFGSDLQECLNHLYDPLYEPPESLWGVIGIDLREGVSTLQQSLIRTLRDYGSDRDAPPDTRMVRYQQLLSYRYVQGFTQEATAERLGIATRSVRKQQRKAVQALTKYLWDRRRRDQPTALQGDEPILGTGATAVTEGPAPTRVAQLRHELASLRKNAPSARADVEATIGSALALVRPLAAERGISLHSRACGDAMIVLMHSSALRQALLTTISELIDAMTEGSLALSTQRSEEEALITCETARAGASPSYDLSLVEEVILAYAGSVECRTEADRVTVEFRIPLAPQERKALVAMIEDNAELVAFFQSCAVGSRYDIIHIAEERRALKTIRECQPDAIVLDVMLPDSEIDGWELLIGLHAQPETRDTPIVVCSVIADENLALTLGAALYLPKPVRCQEFLEALDQLLSQDPTEAKPAPASL